MKAGPFDQLSKALAHRDRLRAIASGDFQPPVSVKIELTNVCNHDCHFCAYRKQVQEPALRDFLDTDRVLALISELADNGVDGIIFTGGGEPLLHPGIGRILQRCRSAGIQHGLITNGTRLDRLSDTDVGALRWVRFSINAGSLDDYRSVHGIRRDDWADVWRQVERAATFDGTAVGVSFVVTEKNARGIPAAAEQAKAAGAGYVHFRPAFEGPHTQLERQLDKGEQDTVMDRIDVVRGLEGDGFRVHGVDRRFHEISAPDRRHIHCRSTPLVAYVLPTGDVSICTLVRATDFNPAVSDPFLGNLYASKFFDLWNTPHHHELIRGLSNSGCHRCHFSQYNRALELLATDELHLAFL